jgi:predicted metal-dependent hydrolase
MNGDKDMRLEIHDLSIEVVWKNIRNIHLRVYPPEGRVRISAPVHMSLSDVRAFAISKMDWVTKHRERVSKIKPPLALRFVDGEEHLLWGQRYPLIITEKKAAPRVALEGDAIHLQIRPGSHSVITRATLLNSWYRMLTQTALPALIAQWEPQMNVRAKKLHVQKMKTRWGSCNTRTHHIRINSELAKKPPECLEYVVVHELVHLLEPSHNRRFYALMDHFLPDWKQVRARLNHMS